MDVSAPLPVARSERISLLDALRGLALLGILLMNMPFFAGPYQLAEDPIVAGDISGINYWCWYLITLFAEGSMRGIFSMLFGVGAYLLISRLAERHMGLLPADIYYRRLIWLLTFGLIDAYLFLWCGDVLFDYALAGLFFFPFRNLKPGALVAFGVVLLGISSIKENLELVQSANLRKEGTAIGQRKKAHAKLSHKDMGTLKKWEDYQNQLIPDTIRKAAVKTKEKLGKGSYLDVMAANAEVCRYLQFSELPFSWIWEALGFFMIGLALFKWNILSGKRDTAFYAWLALAGYGIALPLRWYVIELFYSLHFDKSLIGQVLPVNLYQIGRLAITLGHIGLFTFVYKLGWLRPVFTGLSRVGQMAFTNYLSQSLIGTTLFFGHGFGLFGTLQRYQYYEVVLAIWAFQIVFSTVWMYYFRFGPFEWVWRSLTYWQRQPIIRTESM